MVRGSAKLGPRLARHHPPFPEGRLRLRLGTDRTLVSCPYPVTSPGP